MKCNSRMCVWNTYEHGCTKPYGIPCTKHVNPEVNKEKPQTNADRIRALSIEEKAKYFRCPRDLDSSFVCLDKSCEECVIKWLQQPADQKGE